MGAQRILIVDSLPLYRKAFKQLVERDLEATFVAEASCGHEALRLMKHSLPDLALVDVSLPGLTGVQIAAGIRRISAAARQRPGVRVLMTGTDVSDEVLVEAVQAGTAGFLAKESEPEVLVETIRAMAAGENLWPAMLRARPSVAEQVLAPLRVPQMAQNGGCEPAAVLTAHELAMIDCLLMGLSYRETAEALCFAEQTVRNHMSALLRKLGVDGRVGVLRYAVAHGWSTIGGGARATAEHFRPRRRHDARVMIWTRPVAAGSSWSPAAG